MPIQLKCACGLLINAGDDQMGFLVRCPACGASLSVPDPRAQMAMSAGAVLASAPRVRTPGFVPDQLHAPGLPPCYLVFSTEHAIVNAAFDVSPVLDAFLEGFAKKVRKTFDVQIAPAAPGGAPSVSVRLIAVDEGNRLLRYFLALFAGKTVLQVEVVLQTAGGQHATFNETHKGSIGVFGGDSLGLLKLSGKALGVKMAKKLLTMGPR